MKTDNKRKRNNTPANHSDNLINNRKKKKRLSKEELHKEEAESKYSNLVYKSAKIIRKEAKVCNAFECQKIVRKIKALKKSFNGNSNENENDNGDNDNDNDTNSKSDLEDKEDSNIDTKEGKQKTNVTNPKVERKIKSLEEKLMLTRAFDLDQVVDVCLTRLGLDPSQKGGIGKKNKSINPVENSEERNEKGDNGDKRSDNGQFYTSLIESTLQHKKMIPVMESVNASILEHNSWFVRREERIAGGAKKAKKKKNSNNRVIDVSGHDGDTGLFIDSLAGREPDYGDVEKDIEGEENQQYDMYTDLAPAKRNRMGQRARKAKAMALEAKKAGKHFDGSIKKWWELKPKNVKNDKVVIHELASGLDASKKVEAAQVVEMGSNWKEEGKAHPSWAARQVQKAKSGSGIGDIEFKGKKITFS